ncbi:sucrose phosphorylase [Mahella sp.]|uniref:sucrose phosphorylase n=1 Tax=Mahella sp. TaxID=2798721 RepID=UPI0025C659C4|nr:sucrose phosphorylase [Mahella sp.]MBZ4665162.1 sucrose phosphorylase [Mahella sp.]
MLINNKVQLITYPDSLGGNLKALNNVLEKYFSDTFAGVHILPPFPSSGDRGFAPITYNEIDPKFGTWYDIKKMAENFDIILDVMVNHISKNSSYFQDFMKKGRASEYADMFITLDKLWKDGKPVKSDIEKIFLRRPLPYSIFKIEETGEEERIWTTFGKTDPSEQIDLDINSNLTREFLLGILKTFSNFGVNMVRLDAVGYVIKKIGTSCFFVEPEIYEFLDWIKSQAASCGIELLLEVHSQFEIQYKLAERGFWIYDFILPFTVLYTLMNRSNEMLYDYLKNRPMNQFTMLDCHDGIPVKPDLDGLIDTKKAREVVDICVQRGANLSLIYGDNYKSEDGFDVHQIRCTYYSALNCDDDAYLAARAIQLFTPGIPQVYYVGLLAGANDFEAAKITGDGREINRHNYSLNEIEESVHKDVVQRLLKLIRFRNEYEAFDGKFLIKDCQKDEISLSWVKDDKRCSLFVDLGSYRSVINYVDKNGKEVEYVV